MLTVAIIIIKSSNAPEVGQPSKDRKELVELQSRGFLNFFVVVMKDWPFKLQKIWTARIDTSSTESSDLYKLQLSA